MKKRTAAPASADTNPESNEPMGIVISSGSRGDGAPRFAAYVWGPVPDAEQIDELVAVA